ncbi:hypothetical protein HH297_14500, partial [Xanthomonas sp. Kuri4-3]
MAHTYSMTLLKERLHDRARAVSFGRFLWERFLDDRLFQASASLAYTTVFALVPLAIVVFGVLSALPILLLWIYLSWVAVLLGASLSSSIAAFRYQPASMRLPQGYEIYGLLRLLGRFRQARAEGKGLDEDRILALEPMLTDNLVQQL